MRVQKGRQRNVNQIVLALAEGLALPLSNAYDGVDFAVDADLFAERISVRKKIIGNVSADDGDAVGQVVIGLRKGPAEGDVDVIHAGHGVGPAADAGVLRAL